MYVEKQIVKSPSTSLEEGAERRRGTDSGTGRPVSDAVSLLGEARRIRGYVLSGEAEPGKALGWMDEWMEKARPLLEGVHEAQGDCVSQEAEA